MLRGELAWCAGVALACAAAGAAASDPRHFALTDEVTRSLVVRAEPATAGRRIGEIPAGADGIENKGCRGASDAAWEHLARELREAMARERWCRVRYRGTEGWVASRFLKEGKAPDTAAEAPRAAAMSKPSATATPAIRPGDGALTGVEWRLAAVGGMEARDSAAWLRFGDNGELEGHTGCNRLRASFVAGSTAMRIAPLASTRMACVGDVSGAQEQLLLGALEAVEAHQVAGGMLRLFDAGGAVRAVFRRAR